jgi:hypothetical protein
MCGVATHVGVGRHLDATRGHQRMMCWDCVPAMRSCRYGVYLPCDICFYLFQRGLRLHISTSPTTRTLRADLVAFVPSACHRAARCRHVVVVEPPACSTPSSSRHHPARLQCVIFHSPFSFPVTHGLGQTVAKTRRALLAKSLPLI